MILRTSKWVFVYKTKRGGIFTAPMRMQKRYKPGYVRFFLPEEISSVIYLDRLLLNGSGAERRAAYPPAMDEQPFAAGIFGIATHRMCGMPCCHGTRWALTPPFHPYLRALEDGGGRFLSHYPDVAAGLLLANMVLCVARTFLFMRLA